MENYTIKVLGPTWGAGEWPTRVRCQHESSDDDMRWYVPERTCRDVSKISILFLCSECGATDFASGSWNYTLEYCPACGAKVVE